MTITREDFLGTTLAKSDQINGSDLLGGPLVCQITDIRMTGSSDQPITIYVDSHPQPWKPSLTSRRVLAHCWPDDPSSWVGRVIVLWNDPTVVWAGKADGGIRCSHMSDITEQQKIVVQRSKGKKGVETVDPYQFQQEQQAPQQPSYWPDEAFEKQYTKAEPLLMTGEKIADDVIAALEARALLSEGQKARLRRCVNQQPQQDDEPPLEQDGDPFADQEE